jgi:hypothetical protein
VEGLSRTLGKVARNWGKGITHDNPGWTFKLPVQGSDFGNDKRVVFSIELVIQLVLFLVPATATRGRRQPESPIPLKKDEDLCGQRSNSVFQIAIVGGHRPK